MKQPTWFGGAVIAGAFVLAGAVGVTANAQTMTPSNQKPTAPMAPSTTVTTSPCPSPSATNGLVQSTLATANCATPVPSPSVKPSTKPTINPVASSAPGTLATPGALATP